MFTICPQLNKYGQATLVILVLVMVVSLAVGVASSNRAISNIKRVSYSSQGDQAFHCAESGIELALDRLEKGEDPLQVIGSATLQDSEGVSICSYSYSTAGFSDNPVKFSLIKQDDSQEINLEGYRGSLQVFFGSDPNSALEISLVEDTSPYTVTKFVYGCQGRGSTLGFDDGTANSGQGLPCGSEELSISDHKLMRVKPLFASTSVVFYFSNMSSPIPAQGYKITSIGKADTVERRVEVIRTSPQLPAIFDYAIFSESQTEPLSK